MTPVHSDHRREKDFPQCSHVIQYVDVLTGSNSQALGRTSQKPGKCAVATAMLPWTKRATTKPYNVNSRYHKRYALSFFAKQRVSGWGDLGQPPNDPFYCDRPLLFCAQNQLTFDFGD